MNEAAATATVCLNGPAALLLHELLHAMAQPLTGLQLCRLPAARCKTDEDSQELLDDLAGQVESLTAIYRALRLLVDEAEGDRKPADLASLMRRLERGWRQRAARHGIDLRLHIDGAPTAVWGGPGVEQALDHIFDAVLSSHTASSAPEPIVHVTGTEVIFTGTLPEAQPADTWTLRVAQLLIERAAGTVVYTGQPGTARVQLARA